MSQNLRKFFMAKADCAQRESEMYKELAKKMDETSEEETSDEDETPKAAAKSKPAKPVATSAAKKAKAPVEEADEANDDMFESDDTDAELAEPTTDDVRKVVKDFAAKHGKDKAAKLLSKFKAAAISDIKKNDYSKVIELAQKHM